MKSGMLGATKTYCMGLFMLILIVSSSAALAQSPGDNLKAYIDLAAPELRAKTMEIIKGSMNFTEEEGKAFWPLYKKYEDESGAITDRMIAFLKDYQASIKSLSNAKANEFSEKVFEIDEQKIRLNKKYYKEFCRALPPTRVLQFFQISRRIDTLVSMRIASILPMIGEDW
jgi:hypothetical protein